MQLHSQALARHQAFVLWTRRASLTPTSRSRPPPELSVRRPAYWLPASNDSSNETQESACPLHTCRRNAGRAALAGHVLLDCLQQGRAFLFFDSPGKAEADSSGQGVSLSGTRLESLRPPDTEGGRRLMRLESIRPFSCCSLPVSEGASMECCGAHADAHADVHATGLNITAGNVPGSDVIFSGGGAIVIASDSPSITHSRFVANSATSGGAVYVTGQVNGLGRSSAPLSSCRSPQAGLKFSYRSNRVTRH